MKEILRWGWSKVMIPPKARRDKRNLPRVFHVRCINKNFKPEDHRNHDIALITGDGATLPAEVKEFETWDVPHDIFAVNKSLSFFQRPIKHWTAVDAEESGWFAENLKEDVLPAKEDGRLLRHTIGICTNGYDIFWEAVEPMENETQSRLWVGNTGYFALLASLAMGYKKVVLAGIPLDFNRCWYESIDEVGPHWVPETYTTWMDFKIKIPEAEKARSMGGYSGFILGKATKEWLNGFSE